MTLCISLVNNDDFYFNATHKKTSYNTLSYKLRMTIYVRCYATDIISYFDWRSRFELLNTSGALSNTTVTKVWYFSNGNSSTQGQTVVVSITLESGNIQPRLKYLEVLPDNASRVERKVYSHNGHLAAQSGNKQFFISASGTLSLSWITFGTDIES